MDHSFSMQALILVPSTTKRCPSTLGRGGGALIIKALSHLTLWNDKNQCQNDQAMYKREALATLAMFKEFDEGLRVRTIRYFEKYEQAHSITDIRLTDHEAGMIPEFLARLRTFGRAGLEMYDLVDTTVYNEELMKMGKKQPPRKPLDFLKMIYGATDPRLDELQSGASVILPEEA